MANQIIYRNWTFSGNQIQEGNPYDEISLSCSALGSSTIQVTVKCSDSSIVNFLRNEPLIYRRNGRMPVFYYVQSIQRVGPELYTISGTSKVGLLEQRSHRGGIYTGQTVVEVVQDICKPLPVYVKSSLAGIELYGWLPYAKPPDRSARDNLAQVLFAIGAYLGVDQDGIFRVEPLWTGISSAIPGNRIYNDASVQYNAAVTSVTVTSHQYQQGAEADRTTLFEGTATAGTTVVFDEPMTALQATGFSIQESNANYAVLTAGSGALTGIPYLHLTNDFTRAIADTPVDNIVTVTDATLVSIANASAVADRMQAYYACAKTIFAPVAALTERPGYVVKVFDPYDQQMVTATLASADITLSGTLRAEETLLVGFIPPSSEDISYEAKREVLTGSGNFVVPAGVTNITYVLLSGAQGGGAGQQGGTASGSKTHTYQGGEFNGKITLWGGPGGAGGQGGLGGKGSKIFQGDMSVTPGQIIPYACGLGGLGADYPSTAGAEGGPTTFGDATSNSGGYPQSNGWEDPITGDIYAISGDSGLPGGNGAGAVDGYVIPNGTSDPDQVLVYQPSTAATDESGGVWPGAPTRERSAGVAYWQTFDTNTPGNAGAWAGYQLGPGGVAGVTQSMPTARGTNTFREAYAANGLTPPAPSAIPAKPGLTKGGRGGYGGGGGSCASWAGAEKRSDFPLTIETYAGTPGAGGPGGKGGPGGDGLIILYYNVATIKKSGPLVTKTSKWFNDKFGRRFIV